MVYDFFCFMPIHHKIHILCDRGLPKTFLGSISSSRQLSLLPMVWNKRYLLFSRLYHDHKTEVQLLRRSLWLTVINCHWESTESFSWRDVNSLDIILICFLDLIYTFVFLKIAGSSNNASYRHGRYSGSLWCCLQKWWPLTRANYNFWSDSREFLEIILTDHHFQTSLSHSSQILNWHTWLLLNGCIFQ